MYWPEPIEEIVLSGVSVAGVEPLIFGIFFWVAVMMLPPLIATFWVLRTEGRVAPRGRISTGFVGPSGEPRPTQRAA